jgi:hypothetical protein
MLLASLFTNAEPLISLPLFPISAQVEVIYL